MKITKRIVADSEVTLDEEYRDDPDEVSLLGIAKKREADRIAKEEAEARAKRIAELKEQYEGLFDKVEGESNDDRINRMFEALVPASGPAETVVGEFIRALAKIGYRWYNDGDYYFMGYGKETAGGAAAYLIDKVPGLGEYVVNYADSLTEMPSDDSYENHLEGFDSIVLDYIDNNLDKLLDKNGEDSVGDYDGVEFFEDIEPKTEWDIEIPWEVARFYELGLSASDVANEVQDWMNNEPEFRGISVSDPWASDSTYIEFDEIPLGSVSALEEYFDSLNIWSGYVEQLIDEYGDPDEEDEDYDEDEEDDYDEEDEVEE